MNEISLSVATPHFRYLTWAEGVVGLRGKKVVEIGGCTPIRHLVELKPALWTCYDLDRQTVTEFQKQAIQQDLLTMSAHLKDATTISSNEAFDVAYSINAFEHIANLSKVLDVIYASLLPGGYLFAVFGPIWSSDVGHHLSVKSEKGPLLFSDGILHPWEHLTSSPSELHQRLLTSFSKKDTDRIIEYIYNYPDLNRLFESDYDQIFASCPFQCVLRINRRFGKPPMVHGAMTTREILIVLKKGNAFAFEKFLFLVKFGFSFLRSKLKCI